jgi:hypothetical protein
VRRGAAPSSGTPGAGGDPGALRRARWVAVGLAALAFACAGNPKEDLDKRAHQYMELKQKRDWASIYDGLLDPESRKTLAREEFLKHRKSTFDILGFQMVSTQMDEGQGSAKVVAKIDANIVVLSPRGGTTMVHKELDDSQAWVRRDGTWYIQLEG